MEQEKLNEILNKHKMWILNETGGEKADLRGADLWGADLCGADLRGANLRGADLYGANLSGSDLCGADLYGSDLCGADLSGANLRIANLRGADLSGANLRGANLYGAELSRSNLRGADISGANLSIANIRGADLSGAKIENDIKSRIFPISCPEYGSFVGWKKCGEYIVMLAVPETARRSSAYGRKCRCDKAVCISIQNVDGSDSGLNSIASDYDNNFIYKVGQEVSEPSFCEDRWEECAAGIHFFITRQEAVEYR